MMGPAFKDDLETVSRNRITMTVYDQESLHEAVDSLIAFMKTKEII